MSVRIAAASLVTALALAASAPLALAGPSLTLYTSDLGFVREARDLTLHAPRDTVRLEDVSTALDFSSVRLAIPGAAVARLAYRYDTASGDGLLARAVGQRVRVQSRGDRVDEGMLVSVDGTWLVLRGDDGGVMTLARAAVEQVRMARPGAALSLKPALEAVVTGASGRVRAELSYLTAGLSWSAEHMLVRTGETTGVWSATVQLQNTTGRAYEDARLKLIAGDVARTEAPAPRVLMKAMMAADAAPSEPTQQAFADLHLYTVPGTVTLRDRESQSITLLAPRPVSLRPRYVFRNGDPAGVLNRVEVVNSAAAGPGVPLPAGRVRAFRRDADQDLQFVGEASVPHTAVDETCTIDLGYAFDLKAERRQTNETRVSDRERRYSIEVVVRNRKAVPATIVVEESLGGDTEILQSSVPAVRRDAGTVQFTLEVAPGRETVLRYDARQRW